MPLTLDGSAGMTAPQGTIYNGLQKATAVSASGTSVDFINLPSWVTRITVLFNGVSTNGTSNLLIQLGSGSFTTTGYTSSAWTNAATAATNGFLITQSLTAATGQNGAVTITNITSNTWSAFGVLAFSNASLGNASGGSVSLSGTLDRVRITTVAGTDTFDAGTINIMYE
jgi:hypothetical protein